MSMRSSCIRKRRQEEQGAATPAGSLRSALHAALGGETFQQRTPLMRTPASVHCCLSLFASVMGQPCAKGSRRARRAVGAKW